MKKLFILVGILGVIAVGLVVATLMSINPIIEKAVNTAGPRILLADVHLDTANVSFMSGSGKLQGLTVGSPTGFAAPHVMKLGAVEVKLDTASLTKDVIIIEKIRVEAPELTYEKSGKLDNFTALLNNVKQTVGNADSADATSTAGKSDAPADSAGTKVIIKDFLITSAKVNVALTALGGEGMSITLGDIHLTNIGEKSGGATAAEAMQQILGELNRSISSAVTGALMDVTKLPANAIKGATDVLQKGDTGAVENLGSGLKKLFK